MSPKLKSVIEDLQCSGCINGGDTTCFVENLGGGVGCGKHFAGTIISGVGKIFLGMPKGFCRLGPEANLKPNIYEKWSDSSCEYDTWNVPAWKYLSPDGYTFVRGLMPRTNKTFIHVFLEDCLDKINCLEISENDIKFMD